MAYTTNFPVNPGIFIQTVISGATTNATSSSITNYSLPVTYQVSIAGTGTVSATVTIYGTATMYYHPPLRLRLMGILLLNKS